MVNNLVNNTLYNCANFRNDFSIEKRKKERKMEKMLEKKIVLLRGGAGCGKSTFIASVGLTQYVLSPDDIRLEIAKPELMPDGTYQIPQNNHIVLDILFDRLESRMQKDEFIVIDATNSSRVEMSSYKDRADIYGYQVLMVDMTDIPIDVCKAQNAARMPEYKRVPEWVIDKMYQRFETEIIPDGITVVKPDQLLAALGAQMCK